MVEDRPLTAAQLRAGRALLDWPQQRLAEAAEVGISTVRDFEAGRRNPYPASMSAMRRAMEAAGVEFIPENGGGPGVRLRDRQD